MAVFVKQYPADDARFIENDREIWRYAGYPGIPDVSETALLKLLTDVKHEMSGAFVYKVCWIREAVRWEGDRCILPFETDSASLMKCLRGSGEVILFAATVGLAVDRKIARLQHTDKAKALIMQAYGAERVEALCDVFCAEQQREAKLAGMECTPRFSPGYGDLALTHQKDFFRLLDVNRQIGVSLNDSLLMTPSKSVTAIFGIGQDVRLEREKDRCEECDKTNCGFRGKICRS